MEPPGTSFTFGGSSETQEIVASSDRTLERECSSPYLHHEVASLNEIQTNSEQDGTTEILVANKKLRSKVWKDFEFTLLDDGTKQATCKHCKRAYAAGNRAGTSHLKYHIGVCPNLQASKKRKSPRSVQIFCDLFAEYASLYSQTSSDPSTSRNFEVDIASSIDSSSSLHATRLGLKKFIYESNSTQHNKSELEVYLEDPSCPGIVNTSFDILAWWRTNGPKYPILSRMARDVLSVPLSTVASESAFSSAKRILDEYRCNLLPETIEAILCSHDWLKGRIPETETAPIYESYVSARSQEDITIDD